MKSIDLLTMQGAAGSKSGSSNCVVWLVTAHQEIYTSLQLAVHIVGW